MEELDYVVVDRVTPSWFGENGKRKAADPMRPHKDVR
jgi:hypothetical protein